MRLTVYGCHGGETPRHRTSAFVLDGKLAVDAGALTSGMELPGQSALEAVLVSHAHLDHVRDLATVADNRAQHGCKPLLVAGTKVTIDILKKHFFNGLLWPDFAKIPTAKAPTIKYVVLKPEVRTTIAGYSVRAIMVTHTIETCAFVIEKGGRVVAYSGDTGPTDRLWDVLNAEKRLAALLMEVSFPNAEQKLAKVSGHHTPQTLGPDLMRLEKVKDIPTLIYHIKPVFQKVVERELAKIKGPQMTILDVGDELEL